MLGHQNVAKNLEIQFAPTCRIHSKLQNVCATREADCLPHVLF